MSQSEHRHWPPESIFATSVAGLATLLMVGAILIGSRRLAHFDAALVGYTFATLFATFGISYRFTIWLQRPPTAMYWKRGWQVFLRPGSLVRHLFQWLQRFVTIMFANSFIWKRGVSRGAAHWLVMWGCILASAITFPLVFGWIHFEYTDATFQSYTAVVFGFPFFSFGIHSVPGFLIFHGLVWASFLVIAGVMIAMRRRMIGHDAQALQRFGEDFLPLILLFSVSFTGLMLVVSYEWMDGYAYEFLAITHAVTVIVTLLWLPFGKLFHIFQRPAQLGVLFYKDAGRRGAQAACAVCEQEFASLMHVEDLIEVERQLGYCYEFPEGLVDHYQRICPRCRRLSIVAVQSRLWSTANHLPQEEQR
ncbi:MAG: MFS transporter [Planctomycetaceae bacterium]